jgi:hypothetical protein
MKYRVLNILHVSFGSFIIAAHVEFPTKSYSRSGVLLGSDGTKKYFELLRAIQSKSDEAITLFETLEDLSVAKSGIDRGLAYSLSFLDL